MNHKKALLAGFLALALAVPAAAQKMKTISGQGRYTSRTLAEMPAFTKVEVRGDVEVDFMQQPNVAVNVSGPENLVHLADVRVENGVLIIGYTQPVRVRGERNLKVAVSAPELEFVSVQQGGEFEVIGSLHTNAEVFGIVATQNADVSIDHLQSASSVHVTASDRAEVELNHMQVQRVDAFQNDRAEIDLSGKTQGVLLVNGGSRTLDAEDLRSETVAANLFSSGDIKAYVTYLLVAKAEGRGKIIYKGYPTEIERKGNLKKIRRDRDDDHDYDDDDYDD